MNNDRVVLVFGSEGHIGKAIRKGIEFNYRIISFDIVQTVRPDYYQIEYFDIDNLKEILKDATQNFKIEAVILAQGSLIGGNLLDTPLKKIDEIMKVNFYASYVIAQVTLPKLLDQSYGKYIFIGSVFSEKAGPSLIGYNCSKSALVQLSNSIVEDYKSHGIISNVISPGIVSSPLANKVPIEMIKEKKWVEIMKSDNMKKIQPEVITKIVSFMLEQDGSINGQNLIVDGAINYSV